MELRVQTAQSHKVYPATQSFLIAQVSLSGWTMINLII